MRFVRIPINLCFRISAGIFALLAVVLIVVDRPVKEERHIAQRRAAGQTVPLHSYVAVWSWYGLWANAALAGVMVALSPFAGRRVEWRDDRRDHKLTRWEQAGIGLLAIGAAVSNAPRLGHSLWGDEEFTMKRLIAHEVKRLDDGSLRIEPHTWQTALWGYRKTTNHVGYTVIAKAFHDVFFKRGTGPRDPFFSETLVRLPVYLAGLLSIFALAWAALVWGFRGGTLIAVLAYVSHAWFMRFGVDARGYGFVLLFVPVLVGALGRAVQTGRWRWWLLFGLAEFFLIWTFFGIIYIVLCVNLAALAMVWLLPLAKTQRVTLLARWAVANVMAAMLVVALMAPCLPQLLEFMATKPLQGTLDRGWFVDAVCYLACGVPWHEWEPANPLCASLEQGQLSRGTTLGILALLAFAFVLGCALLVADSRKRWLLLPVIAAPALMIAHQSASGIRPYHWYLVPFLPGVFLAWAAAGGAWWRWFQRSPRPVITWSAQASLLALLGLVLSHRLSSEERSLLRAHPIEACRESVALTREVTNPRHPDYDKEVITSGFSFYTEAYDEGLYRFSTADELRKLALRADSEKKRFFVNFGFPALTRQANPEIMALLDDPRFFERKAVLHGMFYTTTREVFQYRAGSLAPQ